MIRHSAVLDEGDTFRVKIRKEDGEGEEVKHLPNPSLIKYLFTSQIINIEEENGQVRIRSERKEVTVKPHSVQW